MATARAQGASAPSVACLIVAALALAVAPAGTTDLREAAKLSKEDVRRALDAELAESADVARLARYVEGLEATFRSLPKNVHGNLDSDAVRYILHRFFIHRHGWYIRGLEKRSISDGGPNVQALMSTSAAREWIPSHMLDLMAKRTGEVGVSLRELAAMAATFEDLVDAEARKRLTPIFEAFGIPLAGPIDEQVASEVVDTVFVTFLNSGSFNVTDRITASMMRNLFAMKFASFDIAMDWFRDFLKSHGWQPGQDFNRTARIAEDIGENFHTYMTKQCERLKGALIEMESSKVGRVRLSQFYKKALYGSWKFEESIDYLRVLGALDESDPAAPQVIIANYVSSRTNCLESSGVYAMCCRSECEDLMGRVEAKIGGSMAEASKIAELVASLPSASVSAPRELPRELHEKLDQVAGSNGGRVPLHGRLFAQWMHHAYPRECPYPHESSTAGALSHDDWIEQSGPAGTHATRAEMQQAISADTCAADGAGGDGCGGSLLPWSDREELLAAHDLVAAPSEAVQTQEVPPAAPPRRAAGQPSTGPGEEKAPEPDVAGHAGCVATLGFFAASALALGALGRSRFVGRPRPFGRRSKDAADMC